VPVVQGCDSEVVPFSSTDVPGAQVPLMLSEFWFVTRFRLAGLRRIGSGGTEESRFHIKWTRGELFPAASVCEMEKE
jgi:hypothetical protein